MKQCSISLNTVVSEKCQRLAQLAKMVFQTRMASVSLVHDQAEIIKAGYMFGNGFIDRSTSIGAHVVLSHEPMVVLDTAQVTTLAELKLSNYSQHNRTGDLNVIRWWLTVVTYVFTLVHLSSIMRAI